MMSARSIALCLATVAAVVTAFAPSEAPASRWSTKTATYAPMKRVGFASPRESSVQRQQLPGLLLLRFPSAGTGVSLLFKCRLDYVDPHTSGVRFSLHFLYTAPSFSRSRCSNGVCKMASDAEAEAAKLREQAQKLREEAAAAAGVSVEELTAAAKNSDGTVYDDEPMLEPPRENVSSAMKERLMREASTGLDSNQSQTNVILYISAAVAVLVLLGGQGILY